jgi:hypothetical protein
MEYTIEVYQKDRRFKSGEHMINKQDLEFATRAEAEAWGPAFYARDLGREYRFAVHETWVTRKNMMSGREYQERYDTPRYCSPSSEAYWTM